MIIQRLKFKNKHEVSFWANRVSFFKLICSGES